MVVSGLLLFVGLNVFDTWKYSCSGTETTLCLTEYLCPQNVKVLSARTQI